MKTIDERVEDILGELLHPTDEPAKVIRQALLEVARDQRHNCAEAVAGLKAEYGSPASPRVELLSQAHAAVMNAPQPGKDQ